MFKDQERSGRFVEKLNLLLPSFALRHPAHNLRRYITFAIPSPTFTPPPTPSHTEIILPRLTLTAFPLVNSSHTRRVTLPIGHQRKVSGSCCQMLSQLRSIQRATTRSDLVRSLSITLLSTISALQATNLGMKMGVELG